MILNWKNDEAVGKSRQSAVCVHYVAPDNVTGDTMTDSMTDTLGDTVSLDVHLIETSVISVTATPNLQVSWTEKQLSAWTADQTDAVCGDQDWRLKKNALPMR